MHDPGDPTSIPQVTVRTGGEDRETLLRLAWSVEKLTEHIQHLEARTEDYAVMRDRLARLQSIVYGVATMATAAVVGMIVQALQK